MSITPNSSSFPNMDFNSDKPKSVAHSLVTDLDPRSPISEAYKILCTNLNFKNIDKKFKFIAMTSSLPKEGKSTTATNLAITLAQSGNRVILVDADLRRPSLHKKFGLNVFEGLTNALVNGEDPVKLCKRTTEHSLWVLTAGTLPPNSSELLGSNRMKIVLERVGQEADFVIIDCPPVLGLNDALAIAVGVDGFLFVVGSGVVPKKALEQAKGQLEKVGGKIIGAVVNRLDPRDGRDSYYYGPY